MEKKVRVDVYTEDAVFITADLENFDGDVQKWRAAFYDLWRYQMTWHFAHRIYVEDTRDGVYVGILCKPAYERNVVEAMEGLGYRKVQTQHDDIGAIECTEFPDDMPIDYVYVG